MPPGQGRPVRPHDRWVDAIAPHVTADQTVLFLGEGSGAIVARRAIQQPTVIAEANTVPCCAHSSTRRLPKSYQGADSAVASQGVGVVRRAKKRDPVRSGVPDTWGVRSCSAETY